MNVERARTQLAGAMISVASPSTPNQDLDLETYRRNIRYMLEHGVGRGNGVLLVAAAGGEFPMLSVAQRKQLMEAAVDEAGGQIAIATSIQSNSTREAIELALYAKEVGIEIGQLSSPYYYPPTSEDIFHFFDDVAAESGLPIMIYNNWWNTLNMNLEMVGRLAEINGVVALKWSAPNQDQYFEGLELFGDRLALIDNALQHVTGSLVGLTGFITHISNFWPEYPLLLWKLMQNHDYEELNRALAFKRRWRRWTERVAAFTEGEGPFIKIAMEEVGLPSGDPFRPSLPVPEHLRDEFRSLITEFDAPRDVLVSQSVVVA